MLWLSFFSKLYWASYIVSIAKTTSNKSWAVICSMKFLFSTEMALVFDKDTPYFYKSTLWLSTEYVVMPGPVLLVANSIS